MSGLNYEQTTALAAIAIALESVNLTFKYEPIKEQVTEYTYDNPLDLRSALIVGLADFQHEPVPIALSHCIVTVTFRDFNFELRFNYMGELTIKYVRSYCKV